MSGIIGVVVLCLAAILFIFLGVRAWHIRPLAGRLAAGIVTSLLAIVLVVGSAVGLRGIYALYAPHGAPASAIHATAAPGQLAVVQRRVLLCAGCHSANGQAPLSGGNQSLLGPLGDLYAPNLTPGGDLKTWTDGEILRAMREGVDRNGHPLLIMPSDALHHLSDADAQAIVAWLRGQPAVNNIVPQRNLGIIATLLIGAGLFPTSEQPHIAQPQTAPPPGVTPQYGQYLVQVTGCASCHGEMLTGRKPSNQGGPPAGPNLTYIVPKWSDTQFLALMHTGVDPTGHKASSEMPWQAIGQAYTDDELRAIYAYLHALPATAGPNG